jgi:hypothetical protein
MSDADRMIATLREAPGAAPANPEHPAPWAYIPFPNSSLPDWALVDATGAHVARPNLGGGGVSIALASPLARELIRLAPEMEEALRAVEYGGPFDRCPTCGVAGYVGKAPHEVGCSIGRVLAALDAARAAKP